MQFDHLMHWVPDLEAAMRAYQGLGFTIQPGGEHPGVGTRNAAWRIDARYVELITVHDQGVARAGFGPAWPAIDATLGAGGGGSALWVELPGTDAATFAQVALRHGVDVVPGAVMDPSGAHDGYLRLPFTFPVEVLTELVERLRRAWAELQRHGPAAPTPLHPIV